MFPRLESALGLFERIEIERLGRGWWVNFYVNDYLIIEAYSDESIEAAMLELQDNLENYCWRKYLEEILN